MGLLSGLRTLNTASNVRGMLAAAVVAGLTMVGSASAGVIFQADFNGTDNNTATPGDTSDDVVTLGGTGVLSPGTGVTNTIQTGSPIDGSYVNSALTTAANGQKNIAAFTPASGANSFSAFEGVLGSNPNLLTLNGGFDVFVRPNDVESTVSQWFRPIDVNNRSGNTGLRIIFNGLGVGGEGHVQLQVASGASVFNATDPTFTTGNATSRALNSSGSFLLTEGQTHHLGFTFSTDSAGLITMNIFGKLGVDAIDTTVTTDRIGTTSFYANAATIVDAFAPTALWTMFEQPNAGGGAWTDPDGGGNSIDYDLVRLYDGAVTSFAGIPEPSSLALVGLSGLSLIRRRRNA